MKTAVVLRHLAFEDLGLIEPWLMHRGWHVNYYDVGVDPFWQIDLNQVDLLVVLGGPIGAEDDDVYPWLGEEVRIIRERMGSGRPILGICLGAQLMARALGARVRPMQSMEIGFAPLTLNREGETTPLIHIGGQLVLHWHGDQFELPDGVASLAGTRACPNQAFMIGNYAMGWQFHLEVDPARIEQWLIGHTAELRQAGIDIGALREDATKQGQGMAAALEAVMSNWFSCLQLEP